MKISKDKTKGITHVMTWVALQKGDENNPL